MRDNRYYEIDNSKFKDPVPNFVSKKLLSKGFQVAEIFPNTKVLEIFMQRNMDKLKYKKSLREIKNIIYQNIYNNLEKIYKSKGTESSIRNYFRCFGFDDELV